MIRAFIAVEIDPAVLQCIVQATDELRPKISDIRWAPQANCHLTLKFLGAIDEGQIDNIGAVLERALSPFPRCIINAKGLGVFPDVKRPRILWVGIEGKPLASLAERVETALAPLGFEKEQRTFTPHLTIGRWRAFKRSARDLRDVLEKWKEHDFGGSTVCEVKLFQSILNPRGAEYRCLKTARLNRDSA
ncbi:MAG: RNA 2',3'-cyclic phosphodiesterase [Candidatus Binatia bacterium]